jgi:hypothetical protein
MACMSERKRYPSDLTDERWTLIEPVLTAWKARHPSASGHQGGYEMREIVNAILYQSRTGCQWEYLPHDLPPRSAAYYYFAKWRDDGLARAKGPLASPISPPAPSVVIWTGIPSGAGRRKSTCSPPAADRPASSPATYPPNATPGYP